MKDLFTVIEFTIKETIRRKSFIISMIIIIALIVIGFNIPNILNKIFGDSEKQESILIIDEDDIFEDYFIDTNSNNDNYSYTITKQPISNEEIKEKLKNEEYDSCLIFKKEKDNIKIDYIVQSMMAGQTVPEDLIQNFSTQYTAVQIQKAGLTEEQIKQMHKRSLCKREF